jgi:hypothetical protein
VLGWSTDMFGSKVKAIGFTALLEGIMTTDAEWLAEIALGYLVVINAVANGCRLALRDTTAAVATADWPANLARDRGGRRRSGDAPPEGDSSWSPAPGGIAHDDAAVGGSTRIRRQLAHDQLRRACSRREHSITMRVWGSGTALRCASISM